MKRLLGEVVHLVSVLRMRIPVRLVCDLTGCTRTDISATEHTILLAHGRLLCPCGGSLMSACSLMADPIAVANAAQEAL